MNATLHIGIDLGGTKIAAMALDASNKLVSEHRIPAPRDDYNKTIEAIAALVEKTEAGTGRTGTIGVGIPGSVSPRTGKVQNANSTWLNGRSLAKDISDRLDRPIRLANDANCFVISEAIDGAGRHANSVFGVILGTGCGGGLVINKRLIDGPLGIGGEWGHNPLPWPENHEFPGPLCWCGRMSCMETWVSGTALQRDHYDITGKDLDCATIAREASGENVEARATLDRHATRLARGLASVINLFDPDVIVLGGGLSKLSHLYNTLPGLMTPHVFSDAPAVKILPPAHGDAGGARGAAWLWRAGASRAFSI